MQNRKNQVGIDRIIQLDWLEKTASLVLAGNNKEVIESELQILLEKHLSGGVKGVRGSREKTITVLMKIWLRPPEHLNELKSDGLRLIQFLPLDQHLPIQFGMLMAVYPFWQSVSSIVGRLLQLQESFVSSQVIRRVVEQYGERQTVTRSTQRILRSLTDWGVLNTVKGKSLYSLGEKHTVVDKVAAAWLLAAFLYSSANFLFTSSISI